MSSAKDSIEQITTQFTNFKFAKVLDINPTDDPATILTQMNKVSNFENYPLCTNPLFKKDSWIPSTSS
jgi:hypothetical protein